MYNTNDNPAAKWSIYCRSTPISKTLGQFENVVFVIMSTRKNTRLNARAPSHTKLLVMYHCESCRTILFLNKCNGHLLFRSQSIYFSSLLRLTIPCDHAYWNVIKYKNPIARELHHLKRFFVL